MPLKQITFSKKYPYAQFLNYDIGYLWELAEGETREQIEEMLLKFADDTHKKNHPHLYQEQTPYPEVLSTVRMTFDEPLPEPEKKISIEEETEALLIAIETAENETELTQYQLLAAKNTKTMGAYNRRKKQLNIQ